MNITYFVDGIYNHICNRSEALDKTIESYNNIMYRYDANAEAAGDLEKISTEKTRAEKPFGLTAREFLFICFGNTALSDEIRKIFDLSEIF